MRILLSLLKRSVYTLLILFVLATGLGVFLLTTTPGLYVSVKVASLFLPGSLTLDDLQGRVADHIRIGKVRYQDANGLLELDQLDLSWRLRDLLQHQLSIKRLQLARLRYADHLITNVDLSANATRQRLSIQTLSAGYADRTWQLTGDVQTMAPFALQARLQVSGHDTRAQLQLGGDETRYHWTGALSKPQRMNIKGDFSHWSQFHALINGEAFQPIRIDGRIDSQRSIHSTISTHYGNTPLHSLLRYAADGTLFLSGNLGNNRLQINGKPASTLTVNAELANPALLHPSLSGLNTSLILNGHLTELRAGRMTLTLNKGVFDWPEHGKLPFNGGEWQADLTAQALDIKGHLELDKDKQAQMSVHLPQFTPTNIDAARQALQGQINANIHSLAFLNTVSPLIEKAEGKLQAQINLAGTLGKPQLTGELQLNQAGLLLPKAGLSLKPIQLTLRSKNDQWTAEGTLVSNDKPLHINGSGTFAPIVKGQLTFKGDTVPVLNSAEYAIMASPDLSLEFAPSLLKLRGRILIPKALIRPAGFTDTTSLSDDAVFVNQGVEDESNPYAMDTDVRVDMGDDVVLTVKGLQGLLGGGVRIQQLPQGPLIASGELNIRDGKYRAYGQDLAIEQGQLLFTGGLIENPGIRIRATRQFKSDSNTLAESTRLFQFNTNNSQSIDFGGKVTVGIEVSGRLRKPIVRLFSTPASLSQADILSMLLLGKPASQASQSGGQLLLAAVSALNLDSGKGGMQLLGQLKQKLGIDFNLASNTQYNQKTNQSTDNTAVVIGKSLSKRLYISYNVGLSQTDSNVLTLNYLLSKFFSIQVNASTTASGIDLLYTHQKE